LTLAKLAALSRCNPSETCHRPPDQGGRVEFSHAARYTNSVLGVATSESDISQALQWVTKKLNERQKLLLEQEVSELNELDSPPPNLLLLIDEAKEVTGNQVNRALLQDILNRGAKVRIHVVAASHESVQKENSQRQMSLFPSTLRITCGESLDIQPRSPRGRFVVQSGKSRMQGQAFYGDWHKYEAYMAEQGFFPDGSPLPKFRPASNHFSLSD
jgi:hypothetical protein